MLKRVTILIAGGYGVILVLLLMLGGMAITGMNRLHSINHELVTHPFTVNGAALEMRSAASRIRVHILDLASPNPPEEIERLSSDISLLDVEARKNLRIIEANFLGDKQKVKEVWGLLEEWKDLRAREIVLVKQGRMKEVEDLVKGEGAKIFDRLLVDEDYFVDFSTQRADAYVRLSDQESLARINQTRWLVAALALSIGVTAWWVTYRALKLIRHQEEVEQALLKSEHQAESAAYVRSLIESSQDPLVTISPGGKITDVNAATELATGVTRADLIGKEFSDYFTEPEEARKGYQRAFQDGFVTDFPLAIRHKDGHITDVLYNASVYHGKAGEVVGVFAAARDITERKKAELEREQYFKFFNLSSDLMGIADPKGAFKKVNPAFALTLGYSEAELLGKPFIEFVHPDDRQPTLDEMERQLKLGYSLNFENRYLGKDGSKHWLSWTAKVNPEEGLTYASARDITDRKQAERKLQRSEQGLADAQRMAHLGNWELNLSSNVLSWSDEIYRIFEIDPAKFGASYEAFLDAIHPEDREAVNNAYAQSLREKVPYDIVHRLLMKDGRIKFVNERCETYYSADGRPLRSVGTVHDITDRIVAENALGELNRELEARVAARTAELETAIKELESFSYSVSHDLRVPLRAVDGFSRILIEEYQGKLDAEGIRLLDVVRGNTQKMAQLIDDILGFSRTGRAELAPEEVDMEALAREVMDELLTSATARRVEFKINSLPPAFVDRAMMRRVFTNLLANAVKFTRLKETAIIELGADNGEKEVTYFCRDNGAGFDMRYVGKLFGVFQRLHSSEEFEGTGIGLAIVKRVISRHGGKVWAEGKVDEGATIRFSLPKKEKVNR